MIIVGINPGYDSTAAVLTDGKIAAIVEEERLSRKKNHLGFPLKAIPMALNIAGVDPRDVDVVAFSFVDYLYANRILTKLILSEQGVPFDPENRLRLSEIVKEAWTVVDFRDALSLSLKKSSKSNYRSNQQSYVEMLNEMGLGVDSMMPVEHHLCHAASAYYSSGFDECLIVTADGSGDGLSASISRGSKGRITRIRQTPASSSAGTFYASITSFLGFKAHRHEGKITGLAAYGDPQACYKEMIPCLSYDPDAGFTCDIVDRSLQTKARRLTTAWSRGFYRNPVVSSYHEYFTRRLSRFSREEIAAAAQKRLEDVFVEYLRAVIPGGTKTAVALAGGVFANVKLNQRIYEIPEVEKIFIHPNMGDGGNALGSAFLAHRKKSQDGAAESYSGYPISDVYFGPSYSGQDIESELHRHAFRYRQVNDIESLIAAKIAEGYIVGRFSGRMEYGPRALGNRSILASPVNQDINKTLNARLHRTEFMPFAPSVLADDAAEYFEISDGNSYPAEFMTITCNVRKDKVDKIPAVCHVDGTARPHVVKQSVNPSYYKILEKFRTATGLGVIINTSFNIHEEPIICSPADACRALDKRAVDYLAIGDFWVEP